MSESAFYYLIPGGIAAVVAFMFFSSMRIRELKPAFLALVPRVTVALVGVGGVAWSYYFVGDSIVDVAKVHSRQIENFDVLSRNACTAEIEAEVESHSELSLQWRKKRGYPEEHTVRGVWKGSRYVRTSERSASPRRT
ncbi:MAG: hypothetical protein JKY56_07890 [Kofleriaceae bacterium]|nr:hypothetical protein [Kofleriaceae bacterium]